jgi:hypothetical protein
MGTTVAIEVHTPPRDPTVARSRRQRPLAACPADSRRGTDSSRFVEGDRSAQVDPEETFPTTRANRADALSKAKCSMANPDDSKADIGTVGKRLELGAKGRAQDMSIVVSRGAAA